MVIEMKYEINKFDFDKLIRGDSKTLEFVLKNVYKLSKEAINNNEIDSINELFQKLSIDFERIGNCLDVENEKNSSVFYYGMLYAIVNLIIEISEENKENNEILVLFNKYKLLYPVLTQIHKLHKASGQEIKRALNFKSESNLTNFVSRINKYNLLYIQKLGNVNYYSLTPKGKKSLTLYNAILQKESKQSTYIDENIVIELLDELANQIKKDEPSLFSVTNILTRNNIKLKNTHIFKLKINTIFTSLEEYMKMKMKFSYEDKLKKMTPEIKYNIYFLEESSFDYESDNERILDLYNW